MASNSTGPAEASMSRTDSAASRKVWLMRRVRERGDTGFMSEQAEGAGCWGSVRGGCPNTASLPGPQGLPVGVHGQVVEVENAGLTAVAAARVEIWRFGGLRHGV